MTFPLAAHKILLAEGKSMIKTSEPTHRCKAESDRHLLIFVFTSCSPAKEIQRLGCVSVFVGICVLRASSIDFHLTFLCVGS